MFICNQCIRKKYDNNPSYAQSVGLCELCNNTRSCSDINTSMLIAKVRTPITSTKHGYPLPPAKSALESIMRAPWETHESEGVVGFSHGVATIDGLPALSTELAGKKVCITVRVIE